MSFARTRMGLIAAVLALVLVGGALVVGHELHSHRIGSAAPRAGTESPAPDTARLHGLPRQERLTVDEAVARLRAMRPVTAKTSAVLPPVAHSARQEPDLYAAVFTKQLLTQDYRSSREGFLAWVQSESVSSTEPSVVALTPPSLRDRLAVASVTDASEGQAPVPSAHAWAELGRHNATTTAYVRRVITPPTWTAAVANGRVSDPGVTAREVDADLTLQTHDGRKARTRTYSVALTMNLEGPPTRDGWGFVTAVIYRAVEVD